MAVEVRYSGESVVVESHRDVIEIADAAYSVEIESVIAVSGTPYDEGYEVVPMVGEQVLSTNGKLMRDDVSVRAIPYQEVSNEAGGKTVSIAS